jgi:hypothetical protein
MITKKLISLSAMDQQQQKRYQELETVCCEANEVPHRLLSTRDAP